MALPAIASFRALWPTAHLAVAARASVAPLLSLVDGIDAVVRLEGRAGWRGALSGGPDRDTLAEGGFDVAVLLPNSFHAALLARRAGIPERWGYRTDLRGPLLTRAVPRRPSVHHGEYYLALATALGGPSMPLAASLRRDADARRASGGAADVSWMDRRPRDRRLRAGRRVRLRQALAARTRGARCGARRARARGHPRARRCRGRSRHGR